MRAQTIVYLVALIAFNHVGLSYGEARRRILGSGNRLTNDRNSSLLKDSSISKELIWKRKEQRAVQQEVEKYRQTVWKAALNKHQSRKTQRVPARHLRHHKHKHHKYLYHKHNYKRHLKWFGRHGKHRRKRTVIRGHYPRRRTYYHYRNKTPRKRNLINSKKKSKSRKQEHNHLTTKQSNSNSVTAVEFHDNLKDSDTKKYKIYKKFEINKGNEEKNERRTMETGSSWRKHARISPVLLNAIRLVLDRRNHFKKDVNALQLASALQNKDGRARAVARSNLRPDVTHGLTRNGYRARMVRVKDPGYKQTIPTMPMAMSGNRRGIKTRKLNGHSQLVNPTELGISILKLLFGKRAALVTNPEYRPDLEAAKPDARLLAGFGSPRQRAQLQKNIEKENRVILLTGVHKEEFSQSLAKSISDLIKAMNKGELKGNGYGLRPTNRPTGRGLRHRLTDVHGTRKSWVLLKIPKSSSTSEASTQQSEPEQMETPPKHESRISTIGKQNNILTDVKIIRRPNPAKVEMVSEDTDSKTVVGGAKAGYTLSGPDEAKKLSGSNLNSLPIDTESRTVPQVISSTKQKIKLDQDDTKVDVQTPPEKTSKQVLSPGTMAFSLTKILKAIEASIKELRDQQKPTSIESKPVIKPEDPLKTTALASMTVPEMGPPKSELATPVLPATSPKADVTSKQPEVTSKQQDVTSKELEVASRVHNAAEEAAIPDLLSAVQKLLGAKEAQQAANNQASFARIPSDDTNAEVSRFRPSVSQVAMGTRRFTGMLGTQVRPLIIRPAGTVMDEPITRTNQRMQPGDNVLFESDDELGTPRDRQATIDAIKLKENLEAFAEKGLKAHNRYRADHHAPPLIWSDDLATQAEKLAYDMAMKGAIERSEVAAKLGYGENVAQISGTTFNKAGEEATNLWYSEKGNYSFSDPRLSPRTDAFTQVVWKGSKKLGMGCARDLQTNDLYVVALYDPKGNDPVGLRSNVIATGGVVGDVYASIFKRFKLNPRSRIANIGMLRKLLERNRGHA